MPQAPLILVTNDDGLDSPGLQAAAEAVADLGELLIAAPATQHFTRLLAQQVLDEGISVTPLTWRMTADTDWVPRAPLARAVAAEGQQAQRGAVLPVDGRLTVSTA